MDDAHASAVIWRRLLYMLSPQLDIYENISKVAIGARVLEIGFGTGIGILQYAAHAEYVDAVEIDESAVAFARRSLPLRNVRWLHDDITNPTRNYRGYDLVVMVEVLEHIRARNKALENLKKALRPGGRGLITAPNSKRYRRRREALNAIEWTPTEFVLLLGKHFEAVHFLNSALMPNTDPDYRGSPIVAGVFRGR